MSSHVVVISTDLRRATVKVTPSTYLADVLADACKTLGLSSDKYLLKHNKKTVDLSAPFRNSRLAGGAKLELVVKSNTPSVVTVALQIPSPEGDAISGSRLVNKFPSDFTLWRILRQCESGTENQGKTLNITARGVAQTTGASQSGSGQLFYESPVLNIMGRELSHFQDFQKTLSQLGYNSGNVLIRLSYRTTETTLFQAMEEISQYFKEEDAEKVHQTSSGPVLMAAEPEKPNRGAVDKPHPEDGGKKEIADQLDAQPPAGDDIHSVLTPPSEAMELSFSEGADPPRPVNIYAAPTSSTPAAASSQINEADFVPTIAHAQLHQSRLLEKGRNKRLLSDKEIKEQADAEAAKFASITTVSIKVRFPDNTSATWNMGPRDTGAALYRAIRTLMADSSLAFKLVLPAGKGFILDDDTATLIKGHKLSGGVLVTVYWEDSVPQESRHRPFLKDSAARDAKQVVVPDIPVAEEEEEEKKPVAPNLQAGSSSGDGDKGVGKKLPKWLKLPGKK